MEKLRIFAWYIGVILTIVFIIVSFISDNFVLGACAFILALYLDGTKKNIPLPRIYRSLGMTSIKDLRKEKKSQ
ncbi:MAG: hypothetical protein ACOWWR_19800 [Eubacteriales bacterium]